MAFSTQTRQLYGGEVELIFNPKARNRYLINTEGESLNPVGVTTVLSKVLAKEALMLWPMRMALGHIKEATLPWIDDRVLDGRHYLNQLEGILEEASKAHVKKSDKGKDVGSEVHEAIEQYLAGKRKGFELTPEATKAFKAFTEWFIINQPKVLATEQIVYSRKHNYAGTFDALLEIDGKIVLADIKTTNPSRDAPLGVYPEYFLQLGAYSYAYREERRSRLSIYNHGYIDDLIVINASKTGKLSTLRASDLGLSVRDCEDAWLNVLSTYKFLEPLKKLIKETQ